MTMRWGTAHRGAAAVTMLAMVATPFARRGGDGRRALSAGVVGGLAATTLAATSSRWGRCRAVTAFAGVVGATSAVEHVGVRTGIPFGRYGYTPALQPQVGRVPVLVPVAWFGVAIPARETAHAVLGARSSAGGRVVLGAAALTAWDLFLDPQMVGEGYWRWARPGRYRGIPFSNFVGWFVTGLGVMAALELIVPPAEADPALVTEYATLAAMQTFAFASFFRDPLVALVGGSAMLTMAGLACRRLVQRDP